MLDVSVSIVSHNHGRLIRNAILSLTKALERSGLKYEIIITFNVPEQLENISNSVDNFVVINNSTPKGFGANHNAAFLISKGSYFIVCNPDVEFPDVFKFEKLIEECPPLGVLSPQIINKSGETEDFFRCDLTIRNIFRRIIGTSEVAQNDFNWLAGIFLVFSASTYSRVNGFDERYFMYVEDCDICKRISILEGEIKVSSEQYLVHFAQRKSGKSLKHSIWHIKSLVYYWSKKYIA